MRIRISHLTSYRYQTPATSVIQMLRLTPRNHDGQYVAENEPVAQNEEPLTLLVHWADYWTAHIFEDGRELKEDTAYFDRR